MSAGKNNAVSKSRVARGQRPVYHPAAVSLAEIRDNSLPEDRILAAEVINIDKGVW